MAYYRVEPLRELENIANKMRKFVDDLPESFSFEVGAAFQPRVDIVHDDSRVRIFAELPGVRRESVSLFYENNVLLLKGEKMKPEITEKESLVRVERNFGAFNRNIALPFDIDPSSIEATLENGVLIIEMSKVKQKEPDRVTIEVK